MNGSQWAAAILSYKQTISFQGGNRVDIPEAVEEAKAAFIQKPYSLSDLLRGIRQMLDRP
jgi:hypothetical protein